MVTSPPDNPWSGLTYCRTGCRRFTDHPKCEPPVCIGVFETGRCAFSGGRPLQPHGLPDSILPRPILLFRGTTAQHESDAGTAQKGKRRETIEFLRRGVDSRESRRIIQNALLGSQSGRASGTLAGESVTFLMSSGFPQDGSSSPGEPMCVLRVSMMSG